MSENDLSTIWLLEAVPKASTFNDIKIQVCKEFRLPVELFDGPDRSRAIAAARRLAWWRARQSMDASYPQLGVWSGGRDHTTVHHGVKLLDHLFQGSEYKELSRKRLHARKRWQEKKSRGDI